MLLCRDFYGFSSTSHRQFAHPDTDPHTHSHHHPYNDLNFDPFADAFNAIRYSLSNSNRDAHAEYHGNTHPNRNLNDDTDRYDHTQSNGHRYAGDAKCYTFPHSDHAQPNPGNAQPDFRCDHN